ncbi:MAG: S1 RNA-binding domain-containing protein [Patescibacteria group bacterium]|nr:S1 RNA-binding domain-containing protein [Patescibacteria group bacterium]
MEEDKKILDEKGKDFQELLEKDNLKIPQAGDTVRGTVISASRAEVRLDIAGILIGVIRGPELYEEAEEYAGLKSGDEVEATVIEEENEDGELELSFRHAGQKKAWEVLRKAAKSKETIKVKVIDANKGGLLVRYCQIQGFLPVSQLAPENYPRVSGGDKSKILEKLKSFVGQEFEVTVMTLDEKEDKIIFSEKDVWSEKQKDTIAKYKVGTIVEGVITAVTDFGVFISFGENMEGLIHISELAWQRIDSPADLFKVGDKIKAEVISVAGAKIFLSARKLLKDPWEEASAKYKVGQTVAGTILKINPFGLFVKLDEDIHGLAHASQLGLAQNQKINELFKLGEKASFEVMSLEPKEHRLGLKLAKEAGTKKEKTSAKETKEKEIKEEEAVSEKAKPAKEKKKKTAGKTPEAKSEKKEISKNKK